MKYRDEPIALITASDVGLAHDVRKPQYDNGSTLVGNATQAKHDWGYIFETSVGDKDTSEIFTDVERKRIG